MFVCLICDQPATTKRVHMTTAKAARAQAQCRRHTNPTVSVLYAFQYHRILEARQTQFDRDGLQYNIIYIAKQRILVPAIK